MLKKVCRVSCPAVLAPGRGHHARRRARRGLAARLPSYHPCAHRGRGRFLAGRCGGRSAARRARLGPNCFAPCTVLCFASLTPCFALWRAPGRSTHLPACRYHRVVLACQVHMGVTRSVLAASRRGSPALSCLVGSWPGHLNLFRSP
jgi:hypothetical protein